MRLRQPPATFFDCGEIAETFGIVVTGRVKLTKRTESGLHATLDLITPGNLLCMGRPHACLAYCCAAVADAPSTRVLTVSRRDWLALMTESIEVCRYFIDQFSERTEVLCGRVSELSSGRVEQRLGAILGRLARTIGSVTSDGVLVPLALSRRDLAELVATTPETATRVMKRLERDGIAETRKDGIVIKDVAQLERISAGA